MRKNYYCTAFSKKFPEEIFICKCVVVGQKKNLFKVRVIAIATEPTGGQFKTSQLELLGKIITKKQTDLYTELQPFLTPKGWFEVIRKDSNQWNWPN